MLIGMASITSIVYSELSNFRFGPFETYEANTLLVRMYTRLYEKLDEKQVEVEIK